MRTVEPSSRLTRAEPWICENSRSVCSFSQQISSPRPAIAPSSISAAVVIGHQLAAADLAKHLALVGQAGRALRGAADEQIGRPAIDRHLVDLVLRPRAVDDRLVIAGDKALAFAKPRNAQGKKMLFEESFCLRRRRTVRGLWRCGRDRAARCRAPSDRPAAFVAPLSACSSRETPCRRRDDRPRSSPRYRTRRPAHIGCR